MTDQQEWRRKTAMRKVEEEQSGAGAPPVATSIAAAARYVGATPAEVERWWKARAG